MENVRSLKARYVFPVTSPPCENGVVTIAQGRIAAVGKKAEGGEILDLGNAAILPGLINAHTHLEFSDLNAPLGSPGIGLVEWLYRLIDARQNRSENNRQSLGATTNLRSVLGLSSSAENVVRGLNECLRQGVTTVGEIALPDFPWEDATQLPPGGVLFVELIAPTRQRVPGTLDFARAVTAHLEGDSPIFSAKKSGQSPGDWQIGLSPHAPYSVHPDLLRAMIELSVAEKIPLAMHLAESREELQLLAEWTGPFREFLEERGIWDPTAFSTPRRPLDYLQILAAAHRTLIIHGNYLQDDEIAFLADHADRLSVVYCPRSHAWFRHEPYPLEKMLAAGIHVALGTDSRASAPDLNLLAEMRFLARTFPQIPKNVILRFGTLHGARALGFEAELGSLEPGKWANLAVVVLPKDAGDDPYQLLLQSETPVLATWYRGHKINPVQSL